MCFPLSGAPEVRVPSCMLSAPGGRSSSPRVDGRAPTYARGHACRRVQGVGTGRPARGGGATVGAARPERRAPRCHRLRRELRRRADGPGPLPGEDPRAVHAQVWRSWGASPRSVPMSPIAGSASGSSSDVGIGGYVDEVVVGSHRGVPLPDGLSDGQAATFMQSYLTGWFALTQRVTTTPGQRMLVLGAGGGVGLAAVDIGAALGPGGLSPRHRAPRSWSWRGAGRRRPDRLLHRGRQGAGPGAQRRRGRPASTTPSAATSARPACAPSGTRAPTS